MAAALIWMGSGAGGRAEAGGITLSTPAGLSPGEAFRFVFVTDGTTVASSGDINFYNQFVNEQAGLATYNGSVVSWAAIASTSAVNAIDNVVRTNTPVYLADGTEVTGSTTTSGLWSGTLLHPIDEDLAGNATGPALVWTGSQPSGVPTFVTDVSAPMGSASVTWGSTTATPVGDWVDVGGAPNSSFSLGIYGVSQVLIATSSVPEPSSLLMSAMASSVGLAVSWSRRRRRSCP